MNMSTSMEPALSGALAAAFLACACAVFTVYQVRAAPARIRKDLGPMLDEAARLFRDLQSAQARAAGTVRTAERRIARINGLPDDAVNPDEDQGGFLKGLADSLGLDMAAIERGDPAALLAAKEALGKLGGGAAHGAAPGVPSGVRFL